MDKKGAIIALLLADIEVANRTTRVTLPDLAVTRDTKETNPDREATRAVAKDIRGINPAKGDTRAAVRDIDPPAPVDLADIDPQVLVGPGDIKADPVDTRVDPVGPLGAPVDLLGDRDPVGQGLVLLPPQEQMKRRLRAKSLRRRKKTTIKRKIVFSRKKSPTNSLKRP